MVGESADTPVGRSFGEGAGLTGGDLLIIGEAGAGENETAKSDDCSKGKGVGARSSGLSEWGREEGSFASKLFEWASDLGVVLGEEEEEDVKGREGGIDVKLVFRDVAGRGGGALEGDLDGRDVKREEEDADAFKDFPKSLRKGLWEVVDGGGMVEAIEEEDKKPFENGE